ncbi:MAG: PAS domain S-box protein [Deltaproteobacteria bacterium]|jgi:two-component system sensor histidine kinase AtoS|nr:PAS domain S-box protein [Deltaproteobacteria bacterium]MBW2543227.1 PAS domain S-box protein [Deltaproteobacteria bacterium]
MKRKIFIGFAILTTLLIAGGLYITRSIDDVIWKLETIITLHQVEILRKNLLTDVKAVQQDLLLKDSPHATTVDTFVKHGEKMRQEVEGCFDCHHDDPADSQLVALHEEIHLYQEALSRVYTTRANAARVYGEKQIAFHIGQQIIQEIDDIIELSSETLSDKTEIAKNSIAKTKQLMTVLVIAGPAFGLVIALFFIRDFTSSVEALLDTTRKLKTGDLEHKIEGLEDEFGELGESINEMARSLMEMFRTLEENQKRYRMLFESAGDAIFMLEAEGENVGRIVSANRAAAVMHGYSVEELAGMRIQDLETPESAAGRAERIDRILRGEWIDAEVSHRKKDGSVFPVEISAGMLEFEDQKYILAFDKDITERKQTEEALQRTEQLVVVGEMAAGLAHEIKNPLAGIKLSIEILSAELNLARDDAELFERIVAEINRIETLLKNLLSYAKPPVPQFTPIDVNRIIEAAIKAAKYSLKGPGEEGPSRPPKAIEFVKDLNDIPLIVADAAQLQQVILNLLLNAVHAVHDRGTIRLATSAKVDGWIQIVVSDNGKGIIESGLEKIFLPFFTTKPKGTGLGLSICKRLIEQQNGTIEAARNPEGGLTFTIHLPIEQASEVSA